jgi:hypothetical protein
MLSRSPNSPTLLSERAAGMRRLRRRSAARRPFCNTNGCATFLELDGTSGIFKCPVCGSRRLLSA